jgi:hypothetical protein
MAKNNKEVSAPPSTAMVPAGLPAEVAGFVEEQITFPPYWNPSEDGFFYGTPIDLDAKDPSFVRYVVEAHADTPCFRGDKNSKEAVTVKTGEFFTLSAYAGLPLDRYIGIPCFVQVTGKREVGQPQPMWTFTLKVSAESKKILTEERKIRIADSMKRFRESRRNPPDPMEFPPKPALSASS